ncbi:hypothetical protein Tco_1412459 [Tanacetum coccineum]
MKSIQTFLKKFNRISFRETPKVLSLAWEKFFEIQHAFREKQHQHEDIQELLHKLLKDLQIISEELAEYINSPNWNCPAFYDDDDEYTIQYREYLENLSNAITPTLSTRSPDTSPNLEDVKDDILREKLLNINLLIAKIESLNDNSTPDCVFKSPSPIPIPVKDRDSFFEKSNTFLYYSDNSLPEFDTFNDFVGSNLEVSFPSGTRNKIFDLGIFFKVQSKRFLSWDSFSISFIHNPLCPVIETLLPFSSKNEDKVFNPGILPSNLLSHQG